MKHIEMVAGATDEEIAVWLHQHLQSVLAKVPGEVVITIPGGSTPFPILAALTKLELDWPRIIIMPGDDRVVPEDHPASNVGRIRSLMEPAGAGIIALTEQVKPPHFALTWLGMGEDGHIASLFPNTDPQADDALPLRRLTPVPLPPEAPFDRVSLTIPALLNSDALLFVLRGDAKRTLFEAAVAEEHDLPVARLLRAATLPVTCFV